MSSVPRPRVLPGVSPQHPGLNTLTTRALMSSLGVSFVVMPLGRTGLGQMAPGTHVYSTFYTPGGPGCGFRPQEQRELLP